MADPISLLLVDSHIMFCDGLKLHLEQSAKDQYSRIDVIYYSDDAIRRLENESYDVILVGHELSFMDGAELCSEIIKLKPDQKIIGFSYSDDLAKIVQMYKAGAKGFLSKNSRIEKFHQAIMDVVNGESHYNNPIVKILIEHGVPQRTDEEDETPSFTPREKEVMQLIVEEMSNEEISETLNVSIRTIEKHRENIYKKAGVNSTIGFIRYAIRHDLVDEFR